jgi:transcription elongation factor Elf1
MDEEEKEKESPTNDGLKCSSCGSTRVYRCLDDICRKKRVQVFKCASCGKKFYKRHVEDYRPTY